MKRDARMSVFLWVSMLLPGWAVSQSQRWSESQADAWYAQQPWLVGSNYVPANAINQLEMWQAETFDPQRSEPPVWFHDVLRADGKPYREREAEIIRSLIGVKAE